MSAEYLVVHGATCLAIPTRMGQRMKVAELSGSEIVWTCYDDKGKKWFEAGIDLMGFDIISSTDEKCPNTFASCLKPAVTITQSSYPIGKIQGGSFSRIPTRMGFGFILYIDTQYGPLGRY